MVSRLAVTLAALLVFAPGAYATCGHCDAPVKRSCHDRHDGAGPGEDTGHVPRSGGCDCLGHHVCAAPGASSVAELTGSLAQKTAVAAPIVASAIAYRAVAYRELVREPHGLAPPARSRLHLSLRVLLI